MTVQRRFIFLFILFLFGFILNMVLGSVIVPLSSWWHLFRGQNLDNGTQAILLYRLAKATTAILTGSALALSGLFMQSIFRNPIVGPYVLGTSSAAGLGVALLILGSAIGGFYLPDLSIATAAAIGSILSLLLIMLLYYKLKSIVNLLVAGLMLGIFTGAIINMLSYFTQAEALQKFVFWSMGNLGNQSWSRIIITGIIVFAIAFFSLLYVKDLNALLLGENYAKAMGVNIHATHRRLLILSGILVGVITAFTGPIAFVGLAVPHIARLFFKTYMHQILIPAVLLIGAILMLLCDTIAQVPGSALTLPINSITAVFGAPLVVYLIMKKSV